MKIADLIFKEKNLDYKQNGSTDAEQVLYSDIKKALIENPSFPASKELLRELIQNPKYLLTTTIEQGKNIRLTVSALYTIQGDHDREIGFLLDFPVGHIIKGNEVYIFGITRNHSSIELLKKGIDDRVISDGFNMTLDEMTEGTYVGNAHNAVDTYHGVLENAPKSVALSAFFRTHYGRIIEEYERQIWGT